MSELVTPRPTQPNTIASNGLTRSHSTASSSQPIPTFINKSVESMVENDAGSPLVRPSKGRTRYTPTDNLTLVRLCVLHGDLYRRPVAKFWNTVTTEFTHETGKPMADPLAKVAKMVKDREKLLKQYELESGTVQEESDLTQALDSWRKIQE